MGLLDLAEQMVTGGGNADHARVAGGLVQELQARPGGFAGLVQAFLQNGMGGQVQQWSSGQTQPATQSEIENGLGGTGIIDRIAQRTGLSPGIVKAGLAVIVPVFVHHLISNNHVTPTGSPTGSPPEPGGLLRSVLGRLL
ncbi:MAG TPA: YidB family protein [Acidobacteriaceae bacterium]|nr:YidB family protein [Acidobacteriaceae bacterium]